jgi:hypothetical protein
MRFPQMVFVGVLVLVLAEQGMTQQSLVQRPLGRQLDESGAAVRKVLLFASP